MRVLGLMSGTSADGVDAVLVKFNGNPTKPKWRLLNSYSIPYPSSLSNLIVNLGQGFNSNSKDWLDLSEAITEVHAEAALACDPNRTAEIIGCHGQTIFHRPPTKRKRGASLQILQAPLLATLLARPVVFDFRAHDLALGGQGAPLVPIADEALIGRIEGWRGVLNLGGIANLTLIPPVCGPEKSQKVFGWDCGPANSLIDLAVQRKSKNPLSFDQDGSIAFSGEANIEAINRWLKEPYFQSSPPKSTGRERFGLKDLERRILEISPIKFENLVSTMTAFTGAVIAQDISNLFLQRSIRPIQLLIAGGGSKNGAMMAEIINRCRGITILNMKDIAIPSEFREAISFALLAWWHVLNKKGNIPTVTGARKPSLLGVETFPAG